MNGSRMKDMEWIMNDKQAGSKFQGVSLAVAPIEGAGGAVVPPPPPKISKMIFFLNFIGFIDSMFIMYSVHAYQALVPFSTWIYFNIRGDDTEFLAGLR